MKIANTVFEIRQTENHGLGMFATEYIPYGTRILAESPLVVIPFGHYLKKDIEEALCDKTAAEHEIFFSLASAHGQPTELWPSKIFPNIPEREKQRIQELHDARTGPEKTAMSVFMTNAMTWGDNGQGAAVFPTASRINHSCVPNAHFAWNQNLDNGKGMETVHAIYDIEKGEEIEVTYCDIFYDPAMRKWELQHYGFRCACPACVGPGSNGVLDPNCFAARSMMRRYRLREINDSLEEGKHGPPGHKKPYRDRRSELNGQSFLLMQAAGLMIDEGLVTPQLGEM
ncbi:SET domain-containing protein [Rhizodiscina lignyota]|uniref:SET domain-containing protein n=1 Tax=Rhizodiscina lignyota TaxID=1504668 RepID=A0A9P4IJ72_9PEZI|nr:SET domain-containing protein [Rhizodiscina lignyota]